MRQRQGHRPQARQVKFVAGQIKIFLYAIRKSRTQNELGDKIPPDVRACHFGLFVFSVSHCKSCKIGSSYISQIISLSKITMVFVSCSVIHGEVNVKQFIIFNAKKNVYCILFQNVSSPLNVS